MQKLLIKGKKDLSGSISISGSKNATLPILAASILAKKVKLTNVPLVKDIFTMLELLKFIGIKIKTNKKKKFTNLTYNNESKKFDIDGSSYNGEASNNSVLGNWWSHKILQADTQISPVSGSIKEQVVTFLGKEKINLYGKIYNVDHFTLKSKDMSLPKDKRLDFNIWYDQKNAMILKVSYSRMGNWEYRLKNFD